GKKGEITTIKEAPKPKDFSAIGFESFIIKDYLSKLIDMNKPVDPKKIVHSNNYCTFWLKKESLKPDKNGMIKLSREIIENYYSILSNPHLKYKGKGLDLYKTVENEIGLPNLESLEFCKAWILDNVYTIIEKCGLKDDKSYIKIYFEFEESVYRNESKRYTVPSIYNTTDYNIMHNDQIFGLPNNNMGLNSKKPYLENKTRKNKLPYLISAKEVMLQKSFFDYLYNHANNGKTNIYLSEKNGIKA
ncbi:MAG: type I-B CRISPR-associated protein Cas8b/Csh1, partial [Bacilli bacterium]